MCVSVSVRKGVTRLSLATDSADSCCFSLFLEGWLSGMLVLRLCVGVSSGCCVSGHLAQRKGLSLPQTQA